MPSVVHEWLLLNAGSWCVQSDDKLDDDPAAGPPTNIDTAVPLHDLSFVSSCTYNTTATVKSWQTQVCFKYLVFFLISH